MSVKKLIDANKQIASVLNTAFISGSITGVDIIPAWQNTDMDELDPQQYVEIDMQEMSLTETNGGSFQSDLRIILSTQIFNDNVLVPVETHDTVAEKIEDTFNELLNTKISTISTSTVGFHFLAFKNLKSFIAEGEYVTIYEFILNYGD